MPGLLVRVAVTRGQPVEVGDRLFTTEAMKMETEVRTPHAGTISRYAVKEGDQVKSGDPLVYLA